MLTACAAAAGLESPEVFQKKLEAQHVLSDLLDEVRDSRERQGVEHGLQKCILQQPSKLHPLV